MTSESNENLVLRGFKLSKVSWQATRDRQGPASKVPLLTGRSAGEEISAVTR